MTQQSLPEPLLESLSVGNVVTASLRIYRDHFKSYIGLALRAFLWGILGYLLIIGLVLLDIGVFSFNKGLGVLVILASIVGGIYLFLTCIEKSLKNSALISRLVFQLLNNQPETIVQARGQFPTKGFVFFRTQIVTSFLIGLANFSTTLIQGLSLGLLGLLGIQNTAINGTIILIANLVGIFIYFWFFARLSIPEVVVAIEKTGSIDAISRSWKLTKTFTGKIILILSVALLISLPMYLVPLIPIIIGGLFLASAGVQMINSSVALGIALILLGILLFLSLSIFFVPFWQSLKGVIYYDIRNRKEGLGLSLRSVNAQHGSTKIRPEDEISGFN